MHRQTNGLRAIPLKFDAGCRLGSLGNNNQTTVSGFKDIERSPFTLDFLQNRNQGGKDTTRRITNCWTCGDGDLNFRFTQFQEVKIV